METSGKLLEFPQNFNSRFLFFAIDLLNCDSSCGLNPVVEAADSGEDSWISELASSLATEADDSSLDLSGATGDCQGTLKGSKCFESSKVNQICALTSAVASAG